MIYDLQKASTGKRISAYLFDVIIFAILLVALAFLLSSVTGFDEHSDKLESYYDKYEETYGISFDITDEEYAALSDEELAKYAAASEAFTEDESVLKTYSMLINLTLLITSISFLVSYLVLEFMVPLFFGNGQTLGKKIFGVALMRKDGVKINAISLFVRTVLGKYTIETMIPVLMIIMLYLGNIGLLGFIIIGAVLITQIALIIATKTNSAIHDMLANTVAVDFASQMIFDSEESMLEYKKTVHAEKAAQQKYF